MPELEVIAGGVPFKLKADNGTYTLERDGAIVSEGGFSVVKAGALGWSVLIGGRSFLVRGDAPVVVLDPRAPRPRPLATGVQGRQTLRAAMPGKVVRVLVQPGDMVEPGQGLVVVEAMKMQNEVRSNKAGTIASVAVADGDRVNAGDTLVVVE